MRPPGAGLCREHLSLDRELGGYDPNQASKVYAADGRLITDLGLERRTVIPLGEMSPYVKAAFLATEDKRFYSTTGSTGTGCSAPSGPTCSPLRFAEGFSTITMQLARNIWDEDISGRDKSLRRKLREAHVALEIERKYPKDKILEIYLNQIPLGNGAYGVEAASQRYFGKSVRISMWLKRQPSPPFLKPPPATTPGATPISTCSAGTR